MHPLRKSFVALVVCLSFAGPLFAKQPAPPDHWVGTWASAPVSLSNEAGLGTQDMTLREIVHVSIGGPLVRIILTNEFGESPLLIGGVHIALPASGSSINLISANALTFGGKASVTIPAGALAVSDPVALTLAPLSNLTVSIFVPAQAIAHVSGHSFANQTSYLARGNTIGKATLTEAKEITEWPFLKGVETRVSGLHQAVVCFGDSITDGALSTREANSRWPDILAKRLHDRGSTAKLSVLNEGIGGNRILLEGTGPAALARFDRDVLALSGARYLILLEGINDIGNAFNPKQTGQPISAEDLIFGMKQMTERAHAHGIKVFGATLTPYSGAGYSSPQGEAVRKTFNDWIRTNKDLDGMIDFEKATRDPGNLDVFSAAADSGDHLHPKDAGYKAMADSIDLSLFKEKR